MNTHADAGHVSVELDKTTIDLAAQQLTLFLCPDPMCCTPFEKRLKRCPRCDRPVLPGERGFRL